jgi:polynucleotide 5'-hydroxyl-kinase GRC3/NOL9
MPKLIPFHYIVASEQQTSRSVSDLFSYYRCYFFGDVCAKRNPELLLTYISGLYEYFLKEFYCSHYADYPEKSAIPLVINTSGWVKGEVSLLVPPSILLV